MSTQMVQKTNSPPDPWEYYQEPVDIPYDLPEGGDEVAAVEWKKRGRHDCTCPVPIVLGKKHRGLGRGAGVRLCCLARAMEEMMELPPSTLYTWMDFKPDWVWDTDKKVPGKDGKKQTRGVPTGWLAKRFIERGVGIKGKLWDKYLKGEPVKYFGESNGNE